MKTLNNFFRNFLNISLVYQFTEKNVVTKTSNPLIKFREKICKFWGEWMNDHSMHCVLQSKIDRIIYLNWHLKAVLINAQKCLELIRVFGYSSSIKLVSSFIDFGMR
jgi:hypothetical protein